MAYLPGLTAGQWGRGVLIVLGLALSTSCTLRLTGSTPTMTDEPGDTAVATITETNTPTTSETPRPTAMAGRGRLTSFGMEIIDDVGVDVLCTPRGDDMVVAGTYQEVVHVDVVVASVQSGKLQWRSDHAPEGALRSLRYYVGRPDSDYVAGDWSQPNLIGEVFAGGKRGAIRGSFGSPDPINEFAFSWECLPGQ
jgi:hypothetical protein